MISQGSITYLVTMTCTATRHGDTYKAYTNWRCRCPAACRAWKRYKLDKARGTFVYERVDATGIRRRIHALMALGWSQRDIAARLGDVTYGAVSQYTKGPKVRQSSADRIAALYEQMSAEIPPDTDTARRVRNYAKRAGFAPPLAWDDIDDPNAQPQLPEDSGAVDEVAIQRHLTGMRVVLNQAEREEVKRRGLPRQSRAERQAQVAELMHRHVPPTEAALMLSMTPDAVRKAYKRIRATEAA